MVDLAAETRVGNLVGPQSRPPSGERSSEQTVSERFRLYYGAGRDLDRLITTHLFAVTLNNAGSTFLQHALATCRATWVLPREGQQALGYVGPTIGRDSLTGAEQLWASRRRWRDALRDTSVYDWSRTRKAWYFQACARESRASVFVSKSPLHVFVADALARHFANSKFLFLVRNPYAVCEGICRNLERRGLARSNPSLPETAARHIVASLQYQRRNVQRHGGRGLLFTYEAMCNEPARVASEIRTLVPELDDLNLRQRLPVKGRYNEMLTNMNARQIARLQPGQIAAFNRVFRAHRKLLAHFGYEVMEDSA